MTGMINDKEGLKPLSKAEILSNLQTGRFGRKLYIFDKIDSTNTRAYSLAEWGEEEGTLIIAEEQYAGRGRRGRQWISPPLSGLWFSLILRPGFPSGRINRLVILTAVSAAQGIEDSTSLPVNLKWPNDIMLKSKKVGGILIESNIEGERIKYAVTGIGINVNQRSEDFKGELSATATSLRIAARRMLNRIEILKAILNRMEFNYLNLLDKNFHLIVGEWKRRCPQIGSRIAVKSDSGSYTGEFLDLNSTGGLVLGINNGELMEFVMADVEIIEE
ncbi:MAG: biotin--[acetyl-CoA-carboxylase] ligase [Fidelibacterota bacterium]